MKEQIPDLVNWLIYETNNDTDAQFKTLNIKLLEDKLKFYKALVEELEKKLKELTEKEGL